MRLVILCVMCAISTLTAQISLRCNANNVCSFDVVNCINAMDCMLKGVDFYKKQDYTNMIKYLTRACELGNQSSCWALGVNMIYPPHIKQDYTQIKKIWLETCDNGFSKGCYNVALLYEKGLGVQQDSTKARAFHKKACELGETKSCNILTLSIER